MSLADDTLGEAVGVAAGIRDTGPVAGAAMGTVEGLSVLARTISATMGATCYVLVLPWPKPPCQFRFSWETSYHISRAINITPGK